MARNLFSLLFGKMKTARSVVVFHFVFPPFDFFFRQAHIFAIVHSPIACELSATVTPTTAIIHFVAVISAIISPHLVRAITVAILSRVFKISAHFLIRVSLIFSTIMSVIAFIAIIHIMFIILPPITPTRVAACYITATRTVRITTVATHLLH